MFRSQADRTSGLASMYQLLQLALLTRCFSEGFRDPMISYKPVLLARFKRWIPSFRTQIPGLRQDVMLAVQKGS